MVEMRVGDEYVVDQCQLGKRKVANPSARVDENILVDQKRGGSILLSAYTSRAAKHAQTHRQFPVY